VKSHKQVPFETLLPTVTERPKRLLDQLLLAKVVFDSEFTGRSRESQRSTGLLFNRSNSARISQRKRELARLKWLTLESRSRGLVPHSFVPGQRFQHNSRLLGEWSGFASSLYGPQGLIRNWIGSPAWGHGCLSEGGVLVVAAASRIQTPFKPTQLFLSLGGIISIQTVTRWCKALQQIGVLTRFADNSYQILPDWENSLSRFLVTNGACCERHDRVSKTISRQRQVIREVVRRGELTPYEKSRLLLLPCVRCGGKSHHIEHFPPKRYLTGITITNSPVVLWSICATHNQSLGRFIRSLPNYTPQIRESDFATPSDAVRCYTTRANREIQNFYRAADLRDRDQAFSAIRRTLDLLHVVKESVNPALLNATFRVMCVRRQGEQYKRERSSYASQILGD
jgi:hypothetical protein